jgi:hypothetical protein
MPNKCLKITAIEFSEAFGGWIKLCYFRNESLIDIHPFFQEFFDERDKIFNRDPGHNNRLKKIRNDYIYHFSMVEFAEAFFGTYTPAQIAEFLNERLVRNSLSEAFIELITAFETKFKVAAMVPATYYYVGPSIPRLFFYPINFSKEEMDELIFLHLSKNSLPRDWFEVNDSWYVGQRIDLLGGGDKEKLSRPIFYETEIASKRSVAYLRMCLLQQSPRVIFSKPLGRLKLNDFALLKWYNLPTEGLMLVKKE